MPLYDLPLPELRAYHSAVTLPDDFDAFWAATLASSRAAGAAPVFTPYASGLALVDVFDVSFSGFNGDAIRGWLILPKGLKGPLPALVKYIGYGGGRSFPQDHLLWPTAGFATLVMDTRGQGGNWSPGDTPDPATASAATPGVMTRGITDKNDYYYRRLITDAVLAVDAVRAHPAVDPAKVFVTGISQGGGLATAVGGLAEGLAGVMPDVPFMCDFPRGITIAGTNPYYEIARYLSIHRDKVAKVHTTLAYFDGVNFARKAKAPALFSVALMDQICPPSTVFATYNVYAGVSRAIEEYSFNDHEGGGPFQENAQLAFAAKILAR